MPRLLATFHRRHRAPRHRRHRLVAGRHERAAASIEVVLLMPVLFALMFTGMQAALFYHARTVAIAAAEEGARAVGAQGGTPMLGVAAADDFITSAGGDGVLKDAHTQAWRGATTASVTVSGTAMSVIPGWSPALTSSASVPVERLTR